MPSSHPSIVALSKDRAPLILEHFYNLTADQIYMRFGRSMPMHLLNQYVQNLSPTQDYLFGEINSAGKLIAFGHLGLYSDRKSADIGISVCPGYELQGKGSSLLLYGIEQAQYLNIDDLSMQCLKSNDIMRHLASKMGLKIVSEYSEATVRTSLPPLPNEPSFCPFPIPAHV